MASNANMIAMTATITALTNMITTIRTPTRPSLVHDPIQGDVPFDLYTRAASQEYTEVCVPLKDEWNGHVEIPPSFIIALQMSAAEGKWDTVDPHGIVDFGIAPNFSNILKTIIL